MGFVVVVALLALLLEGWWILSVPGPLRNSARVVELPAHKGVIEVAEILDEAGVIRSRVGFVLLALARGSFRSLKAGEYQIPAGSNTVRVLEQIAGGQVLQHMVVFPEGSTLAELARLLQAERLVAAEDILRVGKDAVFLKNLDIHADSLEGYLFPDTYQFVKGMTPEEILARMVARMREKISPELYRRVRRRNNFRDQSFYIDGVQGDGANAFSYAESDNSQVHARGTGNMMDSNRDGNSDMVQIAGNISLMATLVFTPDSGHASIPTSQAPCWARRAASAARRSSRRSGCPSPTPTATAAATRSSSTSTATAFPIRSFTGRFDWARWAFPRPTRSACPFSWSCSAASARGIWDSAVSATPGLPDSVLSNIPGRPGQPSYPEPGDARPRDSADVLESPRSANPLLAPVVRRKPFEPDDYAGMEWVVDAFGCTPEACRSIATLGRIIEKLVDDLDLHPVQAPLWQAFEGGGITGMVLLSESHVTCHSFPELGFVAFNLYCCRQRPRWPWDDQLTEYLGAARVVIRELVRG